MELNSSVVNGLFLLLGVLLSSTINYLVIKSERKYKQAMRDIKMLAKQCESFWNIEKSYLNYINHLNPKDKPKSIQTRMRTLLQLNGALEKITINPSNVNKILKTWDL